MQEDLHIDPIRWGWVTAMFTLAYCLFEIPTGVGAMLWFRIDSSKELSPTATAEPAVAVVTSTQANVN